MNGLDDMYLFKSVVDCGGFSPAARRLSTSKSTIARRIAALEKRLGVQLFHRNSRVFLLTNFGAECYETCAKMAAEADKVLAMAERSRQKPAGFLHVVCPPLLGSLMVESVASDFAAAVPEVRLHLEETTGIYDPRLAQADLVIYPAFKALEDSTLIARKIFTSPYVLVAHPKLINSKEILEDPQALKTINCLGLGGRDTDWAWVLQRRKETVTFRFEPTFSTTLTTALLQAVRCGLGVASLPAFLCEDELSKGNLVRVLETWTPQPVSFFVVYPSSRAMTAAARQFLEFLLARVNAKTGSRLSR